MIQKPAMTVIFGTKNGKFTMKFTWSQEGQRKQKKFSFPANKPKQCLAIIQNMVKQHGKLISFLTSSTIDFPEEEKVTHKQVYKLWEEIGVE